MSATALWAAMRARFDAAYLAAKLIEPALVHLVEGANRKFVSLDPEVPYFRPYVRGIGGRRLGVGEVAPEEQKGIAYIDMLLVLEVGDENAIAIYDTIRPLFRTGTDGLEFEEAPSLRDGRADGSHWLAVAALPWTWRELAAA